MSKTKRNSDNEKSLTNLVHLIRVFIEEQPHGNLVIDIRNHEIAGVKLNFNKYIKLPLSKNVEA